MRSTIITAHNFQGGKVYLKVQEGILHNYTYYNLIKTNFSII